MQFCVIDLPLVSKQTNTKYKGEELGEEIKEIKNQAMDDVAR